MPKPSNVLIHEFEPSDQPAFDSDGDEMLGFYYQFTDENEDPMGYPIGPYRYGKAAENAAMRAFNTNDF